MDQPTSPRRTKETPAERSLRMSEMALRRWAQENPTENAVRGQAGLRDKFLKQVDVQFPDLSELERQRRAECLRRAHMKLLARKSAAARRRAAALTASADADAADLELAELGGDAA